MALATKAATARIIVTDPFAQRTTIHDVACGGMLSDALMAISPSRWDGAAIELYEGAITSAGALALDDARTIRLEEGRVYHIVTVPAEPISTGAAIAAAVGVTSTIGVTLITIGVYIAIMAVTMAISYLATMLLAPGKQTGKFLASEDQPSGLNSLSPPRNMFRLGSRVPEIYGTVRFWPDLIFNATARWDPVGWENDLSGGAENPNATSMQFVRAVYCIGRGHFQLSQLQFGDSPIANANGAAYIYPPGIPLPPWVTATFAVADLSRQELGGPGSVNMWSPWYTIPSDEIERIDVQVSFPQGLIRSYSGRKVPPGFNTPQTAHIEVDLERLDAAGNIVETRHELFAVRSKTRNELRITFGIDVNYGRWRLRVAETFVQEIWPNGNTETEFNKAVLEGIVGHRYLSEAERTYQHETCLIIEATNLGNPAVQNMEAFNLMVSRVLPSQDVPGIMTEWRADGRWITAAINTLTDPFICNYQMDEVDWPSLHAVQASLDAYPAPYQESGFHAALDRQMTADEQLMLIARKARAFVFPSGGKMTFARDERRSGVSALFNRRNRLAGRGEVGLGLQFKQRDDPDGVIISFINAADGFRQDTYTYPEGVTPAAPLSMDLIGAVWRHEICRRARFEMAQIRYRRRSMPLRVTEEGQLLMPTDRVAVVMPWNEGTVDGEVLELDGTDIRLDRTAPLLAGGAGIRLRRDDGRATQMIGVFNSPRGPEWVTVGSLPDFSILVPNEERQIGTLYSLTLEDAYDTATHWFVTGAEIDDSGVTLSLGEDADEVFQLSDDLVDPCTDDGPVPPVCTSFGFPVLHTDAVAGLPDGLFFWANQAAGLALLGTGSPINTGGGAMGYDVYVESTGGIPDSQLAIMANRIADISQSLPIPLSFTPGRWQAIQSLGEDPVQLSAQHDRLVVDSFLAILPPNDEPIDVLFRQWLILLPAGLAPVDPLDALAGPGTWNVPLEARVVEVIPPHRYQGQNAIGVPDAMWPVDDDGVQIGDAVEDNSKSVSVIVDLTASAPTVFRHALVVTEWGAYLPAVPIWPNNIRTTLSVTALCAGEPDP